RSAGRWRRGRSPGTGCRRLRYVCQLFSMAQTLHHVGVTVEDMDRSLAFWQGFMGVEPTSRRVVDAGVLGTLGGYPGIELEMAFVELEGAVLLELVCYLGRDETPVDPAPARPGLVHLCLGVDDLDDALGRALAAGASQVSLDAVSIPGGPNAGA